MGTTTESIAIASVVSLDVVFDDAPLGLTGGSGRQRTGYWTVGVGGELPSGAAVAAGLL